MPVEWEGLDTLQALIREIPENADKWLRNGIYDLVNETFNESQRQVPVATGALRGSGTVQVVSEKPFTVVIGYGGASAGYALWVHENLAAFHKAPTKAKYLEDPANRAAQGLEGKMSATVEGAIVGHFPGAPSLAQAEEMGLLTKTARSSRRKGRRPTAMTHHEISQAIAAIDRGEELRRRGQRSIRRFYRGTER